MTPREIIAESWAITMREPSIRRWSFTSSLLETLLSVKLIGYQLYFAYEFFYRGGEAGFFDIEIALYHALPFWLFLVIALSFVLLLVVEFFLPHVCLGSIIGLGARAHRKEPVRGGLVLGLYNFLPIFAIHEFLTLSSVSTFVTAGSLILRYVEGPLGRFSLVILSILFLFSLALKFVFSFAQEAVVIHKLGIFHAVGRSFKLIVSHLGHIVFLLILLLVISLRIVINALMIIIVPGIVVGVGVLLTFLLPDTLSYILAVLIGLGLVVGAAYFFAYLDAFKQNVWTITYMELAKQKDLDVIENPEEV